MRIWFNHWFSTAYHLINLLKKDSPSELYIIGSSTNPTAIYKQICDEWYAEADGIPACEYIEFCLDFCKKHKVDVFVPRRFLVDIVKNEAKFNMIGVRLFADTCYKTMEMLDDKQRTYEFFRRYFPNNIPPLIIAHSIDEFMSSYETLKPISSRVSYKLTIDEGARSFRVIDDKLESPSALLEKPGAKITLSAALKVLKEYDFSIPILLMPYLNGVEISADCLSTVSGNIVIPRYKTNKRYSEVIFKKEIIELCGAMMDQLKLQMPMNIQFKLNNDRLYLLEINPRMSGGLQLSCAATNINVPSIAFNQMFGIEKEWEYPNFTSRKVAHIETPICLD